MDLLINTPESSLVALQASREHQYAMSGSQKQRLAQIIVASLCITIVVRTRVEW